MGNCCGSESGNFQGEGRTLGASPTNAPPQTDGARASAPPKIAAQSKGRTLGNKSQDSGEQLSPAEAARRAAENRQKQDSAGGGDLAKKLRQQKQQTTGDTLDQASRDNRAARDADAAAQARNWD